MLQKIFSFILLILVASSSSGQYKEKMLVMQSPGFGQYWLKIIPIGYDSTVSDSNIINCIDTLPSYLFGVRTYNLMFADDSNKLAIMANEHGLLRKKFYITEYWKNGNRKRETVYKRHSHHFSCSNFYSNEILASRGNYRNKKKTGRWVYFNTNKKKIRVEFYANDGTLKKARNFKPPRTSLRTMFEVEKPEGQPYMIR